MMEYIGEVQEGKLHYRETDLGEHGLIVVDEEKKKWVRAIYWDSKQEMIEDLNFTLSLLEK
jgi:hypothetical protein